MVGNLEELRTRGQGVIESLSSIQLETLLEVQKRLSALNGRRQRAFRVPSPDLAARFLVSDFLGTDQAKTTGSVRIDSASATLRERAESGQINLKATRFSTSSGTIQKAGDLYQVTNDSNLSPPVGTFDLELDPPLNLSLLSFDVVSTPSTPEVSIGVSENGVTFSPASSLALNGYRINAWLVPATVRLAVSAYRYAGGVLARPKTKCLAIHMPLVTWLFRCRQGPRQAARRPSRCGRDGGRGLAAGRPERADRAGGTGIEEKCVPRGWSRAPGARSAEGEGAYRG